MRRAWRGGAPRTSHALPHFISAFALPYVALLDSLFAPLLFLSRSFASSYLCYTLSTKPFSSSLVSFSLVAFRLYRLIFLFQSSLLSRIFTLPRFSAITFRNAAFSPSILSLLPVIPRLQNDSLECLLDESFVHVCRFIRQTGRKERRVIIKTDTARPSPLHLRYRSETCFSGWLLPPSPHLIRTLFSPTSRIYNRRKIGTRTHLATFDRNSSRRGWKRNHNSDRRHSYAKAAWFLRVLRKMEPGHSWILLILVGDIAIQKNADRKDRFDGIYAP